MPLACRFSALYPAAFLWSLVVRDRPFQSPGICLFCIGALLSPTVAQIVLCDKEPVVQYLSCHYTCANYKKQKIICEPDGQSPIICQNDTFCSESKCRPVKCEDGSSPSCDSADIPLCVGNTDDQFKRKHVFFTKGPRKYGFEFRFERIRSFLIGAAVLLAIPVFLFFVHWFIHSDHPLTRYVLRYNEERRRLGLSRETGYHATSRASSNDLRDSFARIAYHDDCYPCDHERHGHTVRHNRSQSERRNSSRSHGGHRHHSSASSLSRNSNGNSPSNNNRHHHRTRSTHSCRHYRRSPENVARNLGRENEAYSASNPSVNHNERNGRSWTLQVPADDATDRRHSSPRLEGHRVHWYAANNDPFTTLILDSDERLNNNGITTYGTISPNRRNLTRITNNPLHVPSEIRVDLPPSYSETMGMDEPPPTYCEVMANIPHRL